MSLFQSSSFRDLHFVKRCALAATLGAACLSLTAQTTQSAPTDQAWDLNQVLQAASRNLEIQNAQQNLAASRADVLAADHAPVPVISGKLSSIDLQNGLGSGNVLQKRIDKGVGIDWVWERGNKRVLRTNAAQRNAQAAQADLNETRLQQQIAAGIAFYDLAAAQERVERVSAMEQSALELTKTAQRRVQAGDLAAQDANRVEIEARRAQGDTLAAKLDVQRAALNLMPYLKFAYAINSVAVPAFSTGVLGQNGIKNQAEIRVLADWPSIQTASQAMSGESSEDLQKLIDQRPDVRAAQERLKAAQSGLDGALALKKADVTWGASYDHFPGTSNKLFELRMQMPMQWDAIGAYNYAGEEQRARVALTQAQTALDKTQLAAQAELQRLQSERSIAQERLRNYALEILPRAKQVETNAELAYSKGALSLTDLIDARRTLRATQLEALSAKADYAKALLLWKLRSSAASNE